MLYHLKLVPESSKSIKKGVNLKKEFIGTIILAPLAISYAILHKSGVATSGNEFIETMWALSVPASFFFFLKTFQKMAGSREEKLSPAPIKKS